MTRTLMILCLMVATLAIFLAPTKAQEDTKDGGDVELVKPVNTGVEKPENQRPVGGGGFLTGFLVPGFGGFGDFPPYVVPPRSRPGIKVGGGGSSGEDENDRDRVGGAGTNFHTVHGGLRPSFISSLLNSFFGSPTVGFPDYSDADRYGGSSPVDTPDYIFDFVPGIFSAGKGDNNETNSTSGCGLICLLSPPLGFPTSILGGGIGPLPDNAEPEVFFEEKVLPDGTVVRTNKTSYSSDDGSFHVVYHSTSLRKHGDTDGEDNELDVDDNDDNDDNQGVIGVATEVEKGSSGSAPPKKVDKNLPEVSHRDEETTTKATAVGVDGGLSA